MIHIKVTGELDSRSARRAQIPRGFSLVELLTAISVLMLLVLLLYQVFQLASGTTTLGHKRMDVDGQSRAVFDRLAIDLSKMVYRQDVDYVFLKRSGNDYMAFYCEVPGMATTSRTLSVVGYGVGNDKRLYRGAQSLGWDDMTFSALLNGKVQQKVGEQAILPTDVGTPASLDAQSTPDPNSPFQILGEQIFRMELSFLLIPAGSQPGASAILTASLPAGTKLSDLKAIVLSIAAVDSRTAATLKAGQLVSLSGALPDAEGAVPEDNVIERWQELIDSNTFASDTGTPGNIREGVRVYQRYFWLK